MSRLAVTIPAAAMQRHEPPSAIPSSCVCAGSRSRTYTAMNAIANAAAANRSTAATSSEPRFRGAAGTIRSRSPGRSRGRRPRLPISRSSAATSAAFALLTLQPLPDHDADGDEGRHPEEPGDEPLRNGAQMADRPTAPVVRVLRVLDVADDRVELRIRERLLREPRRHVRADADGLGDLRRGRVLERRGQRSRHAAPPAAALVGAGAGGRGEVVAPREAGP